MDNRFSIFIVVLLCIFDVFLWQQVIFGAPISLPRVYFLDVGQGDSELVIFPGNVKILTDAGPDASVVRRLDSIVSSGNRYIDLAVISHPQLDHFNGFNFLLDHYRVGAFLMNGRSDDGLVKEWDALLLKINEKKIPLITLGEGDTIRFEKNLISILSPNLSYLQSGELNDTGIVEYISTPPFTTLLTADIGFTVEESLLKKYNFQVDVLKIAHHGSKYSSSLLFLDAARPKVTVIEVGAKNTYGHPSSEALQRIASSSVSAILRTDKDGTILITPSREGGLLSIYGHQ